MCGTAIEFTRFGNWFDVHRSWSPDGYKNEFSHRMKYETSIILSLAVRVALSNMSTLSSLKYVYYLILKYSQEVVENVGFF